MATKIRFFGLSLFVWNGKGVRVLLPNATDQGLKLPNGKPIPNVHYAAMLDKGNGGQENLYGHQLELIGTGGPKRGNTPDLIRLNKASPHPDMQLRANERDKEYFASRILLKADGAIDVTEHGPVGKGAHSLRPNGSYSLNAPSAVVTWTVHEPLTVVLRNLETQEIVKQYTIDPAENREVRIGNCDEQDATKWDHKVVECNGKTERDEDFAIYYRMFTNLENVQDLPVPVADCLKLDKAQPPTGTSSTCYNGEWCETEMC